jgi:hypothetical protein
MAKQAKNTICLWYDGGAEDAARFYAGTFPDSSVGAVHRACGLSVREERGRADGRVLRDGFVDEGLRRGAGRVEYARQADLFRAVKPTTSGGGTSGTYGRAVANW